MNAVVKVLTGNKTVRKATTGLVIGFVGGLGLAMSDGNITGSETLVALGAALVTAAGVYKIENKDA